MHPMAMTTYLVVVVLFLALAFVRAEVLTSHAVKGSVACLDCPHGSDLSGIQVIVTCNKPEKVAVAYTGEDGAFETNLPSSDKGSKDPSDCMAKITGGTQKLYTFTRKNSVIIPTDHKLKVESAGAGKYRTTRIIPKALTFYRSCPLADKCGREMGSSKTVDLPLPGQWGLAPSSYYIPFFPIIGIP